MTLTARAACLFRGTALLLGAGLLLTGCAQPGQLGYPTPVPATAPPAAPAAPAPPPAPVPAPPAASPSVEPVSGTVDARVNIRTPGPAVYSVRTVVLAPGQSVGWQRHPGTMMAAVRRGDVTLLRQGACDPARYGPGKALFLSDAVPYRLTNAGTAPAELVVTMLLAPGAPETTTVPPACS